MIGYDQAPRVIVYHRCDDYATGSVGDALWWAQLGPAGVWMIRFRGIHELERPTLIARIKRVAELEDGAAGAAGAAAAAQDARAEAPDM